MLERDVVYAINNAFVLICTMFVFLMQVGFAMLESGLNARRNAVNILYKNMLDLCIGGLLFALIGFHLLYPASSWFGGGVIPLLDSLGVDPLSSDHGKPINPHLTLIFQLAFAATAATIVSGAVAGRMRFKAYLLYSGLLTGFVYPLAAFWAWWDEGGQEGWLHQLGFHDFAGSVVVHALGGAAGLAGALLLGPRIDKSFDPRAREVKGHNYVYAVLGVFILWVGWYGFNAGSMLGILESDLIAKSPKQTDLTMKVALNTTLAPMMGAVVGMLVGRFWRGNFDLSMALNGVLAGLVSITASADCVSGGQAIIIGLVGGLILVFGTALLDKLEIDDPVDAIPVHGFCGVWGGLTPAFFGGQALMPQVVGAIALPVWSFFWISALFLMLKSLGQLRVSREDELRGLDLAEHEMEAYNT